MKHLQTALKVDREQKSLTVFGSGRFKSLTAFEKWSLDPDLIEQGPMDGRPRFVLIAKDVLAKKFANQKYLEQQTFRELLLQLNAYLTYIPSELHRLMRIEQALQELSESFFGDLKNYLKHFQSLLDSRIRKIKKKEKRAELVEFERIASKQGLMKRKNQVAYINEDDKPVKMKLKPSKKEESHFESTSKKSFGTMNSGQSNQNQSGSGKNKSGSDSKSGEANALAVLLANVVRPEDKKTEKTRESEKESYDFSSVLSASIAVRQRSPVNGLHESSMISHETTVEKKVEADASGDKDQAFIFHRPKTVRRRC